MSNQKDRIKLLLSAISTEQLVQPLSINLDKIASLFLPDTDEEKARQIIAEFLLDYTLRTPDILFNIKEIAEGLGISQAVAGALDFATVFLDDTLAKKLPITDIEDPPLLLLTLLQACYLVNRIIEEIDDKIESFVGLPLGPLNLMYANIIVHEVIGDRFANRLDSNLTEVIKLSVITRGLLEANLSNAELEKKRANGLSLSGQNVTCLAKDHGLSLV